MQLSRTPATRRLESKSQSTPDAPPRCRQPSNQEVVAIILKWRAGNQLPSGFHLGALLDAAGEDEAKYSSRNVVVRRLIDRLLNEVRSASGSTDGTWIDVGIGEGLALSAMGAGARLLVGVEYRHDKLATALERLPELRGVRADAGMLPFPSGGGDVVTCLEVLEHLVEPERAVAELARVCQGHCVVSVPWEPFFRLGNLCRGKDVGRFGNNREHVQQFRPSTLRRLLREHFETVEVKGCFPWLVAVARPDVSRG